MKKQDIAMLSAQELKRLHVLGMFFDKKITQLQASELLGLSTRQIRRIAKNIKSNGQKDIAHKLRTKPSNRKKPDQLKEDVIFLYKNKYADFGPTFAAEKMASIDHIKIAKETLRLWLIEAGIHKKRRRPRPHRSHRDRKPCFGQMAQADGSTHAWFENRGPKACFMAYIDDATNIMFGRFYTHEGTISALDCFSRYIDQYGIPLSIYTDKHSTYRSNAKPSIEQELMAKNPQSHFQRALSELGVEIIYANSPQAKGRIERLFKTLQDRLIKELRLANISNIEDANIFLEKYIPSHNKKFSLPALNGTNMHREPDSDIKAILCIKERRILRNDNTIAYLGSLYQIIDKTSAKKVDIEKRLDGNIYIKYNEKILRYSKIEARPKAKVVEIETRQRVYARPAPDHPWRSKTKGRGILASRL